MEWCGLHSSSNILPVWYKQRYKCLFMSFISWFASQPLLPLPLRCHSWAMKWLHTLTNGANKIINKLTLGSNFQSPAYRSQALTLQLYLLHICMCECRYKRTYFQQLADNTDWLGLFRCLSGFIQLHCSLFFVLTPTYACTYVCLSVCIHFRC